VTVALIVDIDQGQSLTIIDLGNGLFRIDGSGVAGRTYRLQYTDTMNPPNWQFLPGGTVVANNVGIFEVDDNPGVKITRFYRSVYP